MSGTFTLSFNGQTTAPIAWVASAATIQAAFQSLSSVGPGNASVTVSVPTGSASMNGALSKRINVTFVGALDGQALPLLGINTSGLVRTGGSYISEIRPQGLTGTVGPTVRGSAVAERQVISILGLQSGTWQISYGNEVSPPLSSNIAAFELKAALDAFIGIDNVTVFYLGQSSGSIPSSIAIDFGGTQAGLDMALLQVDTSNLIGGELVRSITTNYNNASEVMSVVDPSSTVTFSRDNMGRATTVATTIAGLGLAVTLRQNYLAIHFEVSGC